MESALYGSAGFYRRGESPGAHFRTSVHASDLFAEAAAQLVVEVDALLGHPATLYVVDIGAGRGEFLDHLRSRVPAQIRERLTLVAVEIRPRPQGLSSDIHWAKDPPTSIHGLVFANEWLDNVRIDVATTSSTGDTSYILVDPDTGEQEVGPRVSMPDQGWLDDWWPLLPTDQGGIAEIGRHRDDAWFSVISRLSAGVAVAVDYGHTFDERASGRYSLGTIAGYRDGHAVAAVPDGSCDITAHVALDACLAAGERAGATASLLTTQRKALGALGVRATRPAIDLATNNPHTYLQALARAGEAGELVDSGGLGAFGWLVQTKEVPIPSPMVELIDDGARQ